MSPLGLATLPPAYLLHRFPGFVYCDAGRDRITAGLLIEAVTIRLVPKRIRMRQAK